ncbi:MAG: NADH-quinone oxidoreductase subunit L [Aquificae bacterium]|nr:NADH-quinone oxidoreductase subunit L [Aquificota bacterium]
MEKLIYLSVFLPIFGAPLIWFISHYTNKWLSWYMSLAITGFSALVALTTLWNVVNGHIYENSFTWFQFGDVKVPFGIYVDGISALIYAMAAFLGFLIVMYSRGYMEHDESPHRFFMKVTFFIGSMLGLTVSDNILALFIFWEFMGLASYLLIAYWYYKDSAADAGLKAFLMTKFADGFFLAGLVLLWLVTGTLNIQEINHMAELAAIPLFAAAASALLMFGGAVGKSAQFPLFPWLLDAMEGPTPVSALIHAATMVNAGVFLVGRLFPFYEYSGILYVIMAIGAVSAFIAVLGATVHREIKKIIAFSTMENLGLMFVGLGAGSLAAGLFHLVSHATFKALLFLAAGNVIHFTHEKDAFKLGGLLKIMPVTAALFLIGILSLSGIPPFSGFYSKEWIVHEAKMAGDPIVFAFVLTAAVLTIFYGFRLWFRIFTGEPTEAAKHAREAYPIMLIPIGILAVLTFLIGLFHKQIVEIIDKHAHIPHDWALTILVFSLMAVAFFMAWLLYYNRVIDTQQLLRDPILAILNKTFYNAFFVDHILRWLSKNFVVEFLAFIFHWIDRNVYDYIVNGVAKTALWAWEKARVIQTGNLIHYLTIFVSGAIILYYLYLVIL